MLSNYRQTQTITMINGPRGISFLFLEKTLKECYAANIKISKTHVYTNAFYLLFKKQNLSINKNSK